jgi:hypothetical protein
MGLLAKDGAVNSQDAYVHAIPLENVHAGVVERRSRAQIRLPCLHLCDRVLTRVRGVDVQQIDWLLVPGAGATGRNHQFDSLHAVAVPSSTTRLRPLVILSKTRMSAGRVTDTRLNRSFVRPAWRRARQ